MLQILEPFNGAVLNARTGIQTEEGLKINVSGTAPVGMAVSVNGVAAKRAGAAFSATVTLTAFQNDITASAIGTDGEASHRIRVVWDKFSRISPLTTIPSSSVTCVKRNRRISSKTTISPF